MVTQIVNALSRVANPWVFFSLVFVFIALYAMKKTVDVLFGWPRPSEVERAHQANDKLRSKLEEANSEIESREATIRKQSQTIFEQDHTIERLKSTVKDLRGETA